MEKKVENEWEAEESKAHRKDKEDVQVSWKEILLKNQKTYKSLCVEKYTSSNFSVILFYFFILLTKRTGNHCQFVQKPMCTKQLYVFG